MKQGKWLSVLLLVLVLVAAASGCGGCLSSVSRCVEAPYSSPPPTFEDTHLVGTWETRYGERGVDRLIFRADGTFKQVYRDYIAEDYVYETPWREWWVEHLQGGGVRAHLQGARYYLSGIGMAELGGMHYPCPEDQPNCRGGLEPPPFRFYDPIADESVYMVGEVVLNVRIDSSGVLLLHHMWTGRDRGFVIFGCEAEQFRRVETS